MLRAPATFATPRLLGERFSERHFPELRSIDTDPGVQATLFGAPLSADDSRLRFKRRLANWEAHGFGEYIVRLQDGTFVGICSLFFSPDAPDDVEVGYALLPAFWNRGYATEMTLAALAIAFDSLQAPSVIAATDPGNRASVRVMEKCGLVFERERLYKGRWPSVVYRLDRDRWVQRGSPQAAP